MPTFDRNLPNVPKAAQIIVGLQTSRANDNQVRVIYYQCRCSKFKIKWIGKRNIRITSYSAIPNK